MVGVWLEVVSRTDKQVVVVMEVGTEEGMGGSGEAWLSYSCQRTPSGRRNLYTTLSD
jgi:hypothetical protein